MRKNDTVAWQASPTGAREGTHPILGARFPALGMAISAMLLTLAISIFPGSALGEEIAWRGFVLPRLRARHSSASR